MNTILEDSISLRSTVVNIRTSSLLLKFCKGVKLVHRSHYTCSVAATPNDEGLPRHCDAVNQGLYLSSSLTYESRALHHGFRIQMKHGVGSLQLVGLG